MTVSDNPDNRTWKPIAWNGLSFDVPADWEPARIGRNYLMFDDAAGPRLEVKWNRFRGSFSHKTSLRKIGSAHTRALRKKLTFSELPYAWQEALNGYDASGFTWQSDSVAGRGFIIYCPHCKKATLIQFLQTETMSNERTCTKVLASFVDHPENGTVQWSLFDIRARLPAEMQHKRHRFHTGAFELEFTLHKNTFGLHRWAPANVLLQNAGLQGFAEHWASQYSQQSFPMQDDGKYALTAVVPQPEMSMVRRFLPVRGRPRLQFIRVWHIVEKNRILAVRVEGYRLPDAGLLEYVCINYEII